MVLSVNTNAAALIALQNLNATESQLQSTQNEVSTGLAVGNAKDNGCCGGSGTSDESSPTRFVF